MAVTKPDTIDWANAADPLDVAYPAAAVEASGYLDEEVLPHEEFNGIVRRAGRWTVFLDDAFRLDSSQLSLGSGNEWISAIPNGFAVQANLAGTEVFQSRNLEAAAVKINQSPSPQLIFGQFGEGVFTGQVVGGSEYRVTFSKAGGGVADLRSDIMSPYELNFHGEEIALPEEKMLVATNRTRLSGLYIEQSDGLITRHKWSLENLPAGDNQPVEFSADYLRPNQAISFGNSGELRLTLDGVSGNVELVFDSTFPSGTPSAGFKTDVLTAFDFLIIQDGVDLGGGRKYAASLPGNVGVYTTDTANYTETHVDAAVRPHVLKSDLIQVTATSVPAGIPRPQAISPLNTVRASARIEITVGTATSGIQTSDCTVVSSYNVSGFTVGGGVGQLVLGDDVGLGRPIHVTIGDPNTGFAVGMCPGAANMTTGNIATIAPTIWNGSSWDFVFGVVGAPLSDGQEFYLNISIL